MKLDIGFKKIIFLAGLVMLCTGVIAQEKEANKVKIKINKDGKMKIDTAFTVKKDINKEELKKIISSITSEDIDLDIDSVLEGIDLDIVVSENGKKIIIKKISEEDGIWTFCETEEECEHTDGKKSKGNHPKPKTSNFWVHKKDGEDEDFELIIYGDDDKSLKEYIYYDEDEGSKRIKIGKDNFHVIKSDKKNDKDGQIFMKKSGKNDETVTIYMSDDKKDIKYFKHDKSESPNIDLSYNSENGKYIIEFNSEDLDPIEISIFDKSGKKLFKHKVKEFYGKYKKEIDLGSKKNKEFRIEVQQGKTKIETEIVF